MSRKVLDMTNDKLEELFQKTNGNFEEVYQKNSDQDSEIASKRSRSDKITTNDIDKSADSKKIQPNDLSQAVHDMMSGQSPVNPNIPDGSLTTEKYADNSVTDEKLGSGTYHNILKNLCYGDRIIGKLANGSTVSENDDGTFTIVSTTNFGQYYLKIKRPTNSKRFLVLIKGRIDDDSVEDSIVGITMYTYDAQNANLQIPPMTLSNANLKLKPGDEFLVRAVFTLTDDQFVDAVRLDPSPYLGGAGVKATFAGYVVLDISDLDDELVEYLANFDWSKISEDTNWDNMGVVAYSIASHYSRNSDNSSHADTSDYAERSRLSTDSENTIYAQPESLLNNLYPSITLEDILDFQTETESVTDNIISITTKQATYGSLGIGSNLTDGHTYLAIMGLIDDPTTNSGSLNLMHTSGSSWHRMTGNNLRIDDTNYYYGYITYDKSTMKSAVYYNMAPLQIGSVGKNLKFHWIGLYDITNEDAASIIADVELIRSLILKPRYQIYEELKYIIEHRSKYEIPDVSSLVSTLSSDDVSGFSATINSVSGKTINYTATQNYGGFGINLDLQINHNYVIICKGQVPASMAYMNTAGNGWKATNMLNFKYNEDTYYYAQNEYIEGYRSLLYLESGLTKDQSYSVEIIGVWDITSTSMKFNKSFLIDLIRGYVDLPKVYNEAQEAYRLLTEPSDDTASWFGKKVLVIGDSLTAAKQWQNQLNSKLGMIVSTHAKGGLGMIQCVDGDNGLGGDYDNETEASGVLSPLDADDVQDKDLIIYFAGYNNRGAEDGQLGDNYKTDGSGQSTIAGYTQHVIDRIYEELTEANNLTCKVMFMTPHCAGKYPYIDADGYEQYPASSGRTMETLANIIKKVCNYNNIPVVDLWHEAGINKYTWNVFGAQSNPVNSNYTKYELNESGVQVGDTPLRYVNGQSYYQIRDGVAVLEEYTGSSPYPYNGDQLHCSSEGYKRIGECAVGGVIKYFGN